MRLLLTVVIIHDLQRDISIDETSLAVNFRSAEPNILYLLSHIHEAADLLWLEPERHPPGRGVNVVGRYYQFEPVFTGIRQVVPLTWRETTNHLPIKRRQEQASFGAFLFGPIVNDIDTLPYP